MKIPAASVFAIAAAIGAFAACSSKDPAPEKTCAGAAALIAPPANYRGGSLAAKQLSFTFDDGPGTNTIALSAYLKAHDIQATFFINGKSTVGRLAAVAAVAADGHLLGNHTQNHYDLRSTAQFPLTPAGEAALVDELVQTDNIISPYIENGRFLFRAPYGYIDARSYSVLHASAMDKYVGHIDWDVGAERAGTYGADWACWENTPRLTSKACGDLYINEIHARGKGIILMHDADKGPGVNNHDAEVGTGNTFDMVKYMVPILEAEGYTFVRADEVPAVKAALPPIVVPPVDAGPDADAEADAAPDAEPDAALDAAADATVKDGSTAAVDAGTQPPPASTGTPTPPPAGTTTPDPCK